MTKEEILEAITDMYWHDSEQTIGEPKLNPMKLAQFLADKLI